VQGDRNRQRHVALDSDFVLLRFDDGCFEHG
jgi:hypothetical protein